MEKKGQMLLQSPTRRRRSTAVPQKSARSAAHLLPTRRAQEFTRLALEVARLALELALLVQELHRLSRTSPGARLARLAREHASCQSPHPSAASRGKRADATRQLSVSWPASLAHLGHFHGFMVMRSEQVLLHHTNLDARAAPWFTI